LYIYIIRHTLMTAQLVSTEQSNIYTIFT
jgi:hypothetical protein